MEKEREKKQRTTRLVRVEVTVLKDLEKYGKFKQSYSDVIKHLVASYRLALRMKARKEGK